MVSTQLKNISLNGNLPQAGVKKKNIWNDHLDIIYLLMERILQPVEVGSVSS